MMTLSNFIRYSSVHLLIVYNSSDWKEGSMRVKFCFVLCQIQAPTAVAGDQSSVLILNLSVSWMYFYYKVPLLQWKISLALFLSKPLIAQLFCNYLYYSNYILIVGEGESKVGKDWLILQKNLLSNGSEVQIRIIFLISKNVSRLFGGAQIIFQNGCCNFYFLWFPNKIVDYLEYIWAILSQEHST